jgi:hypothetical protein
LFLISRLYSKIKSSKSKNFSLDKTIEEAVDETNFEEKLEEFIRRTAHFTKTPESLKKGSSGIVCVNNYYTEQIITHHNIENYSKNPNKTPIKTQNQVCSQECSSSNVVSLKGNGASINNFDISLEEMSFLKHAFSLIKFSMMDNLFEQFKDATEVFFAKMEDLTRKTKDDIINIAASKQRLIFVTLGNI